MKKSRFTLPIEDGCESIALELIEKWGADALRNSDGTQMTKEFENLGLKVYATYFPTRNDQEWIIKNRTELQQIYLMSERITATSDILDIDPMASYFAEQFEINEENPHKYWQVIDRTSNKIVSTDNWTYNADTKKVRIKNVQAWHVYTLNFLAKQIWDVTQMYNHLTNNWGDRHHEMPYDPAFPSTRKHILDDLELWLKSHPKVNVVRFTTFFYHFTVIYDNLKRQKFGDWYGYSASVSSIALDEFKKQYGYTLTAEDIVDLGFYNTAYRLPSKKFLDYIEYQQKFVSSLARECVDLVHQYGKEAMMFIGDNWIGTEPFGKYFASIGLDAVVGSSGSGAGIRMISDMPSVKYREVRFLPYFFPDTFNDNGNPVGVASNIWIRSRRALAIKLLDRMGYGGYLSLAAKYPKFVDLVTKITDQFNSFHNKLEGASVDLHPISVGILNAWGNIKAWQCNSTGHAGGWKESVAYRGVLEALSGMPVNIEFINFEDIKNGKLNKFNIVINMGTANTAWSGGVEWLDIDLVCKIREWVHGGGAFLGVGEPTAYSAGGVFFQLSDVLGVDKEIENTVNFSHYDKVNNTSHFITNGLDISKFETGFCPRNIYATSNNTDILIHDRLDGIKMAAIDYGKGRSVYLSGMPYSDFNSKVFYRILLWLSHQEVLADNLYTENINTDVYTYSSKKLALLLNNTLEIQNTKVFINGISKEYKLEAMEMKWIDL